MPGRGWNACAAISGLEKRTTVTLVAFYGRINTFKCEYVFSEYRIHFFRYEVLMVEEAVEVLDTHLFDQFRVFQQQDRFEELVYPCVPSFDVVVEFGGVFWEGREPEDGRCHVPDDGPWFLVRDAAVSPVEVRFDHSNVDVDREYREQRPQPHDAVPLVA